jgi:hypothetical protein
MIEHSTDQALLDRLGDVYYKMGDLPQAGRFWWLTPRDDEAASKARDAFYERFGTGPIGVLSALHRPARPELYPPPVEVKLRELVTAASNAGMKWNPRDWSPAGEAPQGPAESVQNRAAAWFAVSVILFLLVSLGVGVATIITAIVDRLM